MRAMVLNRAGGSLEWLELPERHPGPGEVRVRVLACGVCRTDLHVLDGELPHMRFPVIPGHEITGRIDAIGKGVSGLSLDQRIGIPWLGHTCGICEYCAEERENLCDRPLFTGYTRDGGYATAAMMRSCAPDDSRARRCCCRLSNAPGSRSRGGRQRSSPSIRRSARPRIATAVPHAFHPTQRRWN